MARLGGGLTLSQHGGRDWRIWREKIKFIYLTLTNQQPKLYFFLNEQRSTRRRGNIPNYFLINSEKKTFGLTKRNVQKKSSRGKKMSFRTSLISCA